MGCCNCNEPTCSIKCREFLEVVHLSALQEGLCPSVISYSEVHKIPSFNLGLTHIVCTLTMY